MKLQESPASKKPSKWNHFGLVFSGLMVLGLVLEIFNGTFSADKLPVSILFIGIIYFTLSNILNVASNSNDQDAIKPSNWNYVGLAFAGFLLLSILVEILGHKFSSDSLGALVLSTVIGYFSIRNIRRASTPSPDGQDIQTRPTESKIESLMTSTTNEIRQVKKGETMNNFEQYKEFTQSRNWAGICKLNGVDFNSSKFGTMKEINSLPSQLQAGEVVFGFTAGIMPKNDDSNSSDWLPSTWLVVLTDRRFLFLDSALLTQSMDVHSILHKNVQGVFVAQGFLLGKISIETGGRSTVIDNCDKKTVKIIGDIANEWLQVLEERKSTPQVQAVAAESGLDKLKKLAEMKELGILSDQEFQDAKAKILAAL